MTLFIENNMSTEEHNMINSNMISVFKEISGNDICKIMCSKKHYDSLNIDKNNLKLIEIKVYDTDHKIKKYMLEIVHVLKIIKIITTNRYKNLIILSSSPVMHYLLRKFSGLLNKNINIFIVCHGELLFLKSDIKTFFYKPEFWMQKAFSIKNQRFKYILLGEHIKIPFQMKNEFILSLNHPNIPSNIIKSERTKKIRIGFIGVVSKMKGADSFIEIAKYFENNDKFEFTFTGKIMENYMYLKNSNILGYYNDKFVSKEKVEEKLKNLDLALFFYDESYDYIASGALLDTINYEIPIFCTNSNIFKYLVEEKKLNFINIFNNNEEMIQAIEKLNLENITKWKNLNFNLAKDLFSVNNAVKKLKEFNDEYN